MYSTHIDIDGLSICVTVVSFDRAALDKAFTDPAVPNAYAALTVRAALEGRTADFPVEILVRRDLRVQYVDVSTVGLFCRAMSTVLARPFGFSAADPSDANRSQILAAYHGFAAAFSTLELASIPSTAAVENTVWRLFFEEARA